MKKIILSALVLSMSTGLFAQLTKGNWAFTGNIGARGNTQKVEVNNGGFVSRPTDQKTSAFVFLPAVSYFLKDNIEAGAGLLISKTTTTNNYEQPNFAKEVKTETPLNGILLFGNYYFKAAEKFSMYGGVQLGVASGKGKTTTTPFNCPTTIVETKNTGSTFGFNMGFLYFIKPNLALNGTLGLLSLTKNKAVTTNGNVTTESNTSNWVVGVNGVIINIGVKIFMAKKA